MQSINSTKLSAAIILALSTAACSSGGNHSTTSTPPVITDQTAAEKAEADRLAAEKAEADRLAAEKQKEIDDAKGLIGYYPINSITAQSTTSASSIRNNLTTENRTQSVIYNQPYSVVLGSYSGNVSYNNSTGALISDDRISNIAIRGLKTAIEEIPTLGSATYTGKAFNGSYINKTEIDYSGTFPTILTTSNLAEGTLNYNVNFTERSGSGSITGLGDVISLNQGSISGTGISSSAQQAYKNGTYSLDFYGKKAEEVAGKVIFNDKDTVGFGGTRGEITK